MECTYTILEIYYFYCAVFFFFVYKIIALTLVKQQAFALAHRMQH